MFFRWPNVFKLQETQTICWKVYSFYRDIILMLKEDLKIKDEGLQWNLLILQRHYSDTEGGLKD